MSTPYGVSVRESRPASHSLCRVRGGNVVRGQLVMLDLAGTESVATARPGDAGTKTVQGSPWATVVPATAGLVAGRVGVVMATTSDDLLAPVELGDGGAGGVRDVIVEALVLRSAAAVEGASLGVTVSGGVTVLGAGVAGGVFGTLLDAAQTGSGTVMRRVVLHGAGLADSAALTPTVLRRRMRTAACSLGGASSTAGGFASVNWASATGTNFRLRFVAATTTLPTGDCRMVGRQATNHANLRVLSTGALALAANNTVLLSTAAGMFGAEGWPHDCYADVFDTSATIYYDGAAVASGTFASQSWATVAAAQSIGGTIGSAQRWPGSIQLVELTDNVTASNSRRYLLDEGVDVASYADSSGNGGAAATKNAGAGYPWVCAVVSHDGTGKPWTGSPTTLTYAALRGDTDQVLDGSAGGGTPAYTLTYTSENRDSTGSLDPATGIWTAPADGVVRLSGRARIAAASISENVLLGVKRSGTTLHQHPCTTAVGNIADIQLVFTVTASQTVLLEVGDIDASNTTLAVDFCTFTLEFTPTATTL